MFPSGDGYEIFVSDANGVGTAVSLIGSAGNGEFNANWSTVTDILVPGRLRSNQEIVYNTATQDNNLTL